MLPNTTSQLSNLHFYSFFTTPDQIQRKIRERSQFTKKRTQQEVWSMTEQAHDNRMTSVC